MSPYMDVAALSTSLTLMPNGIWYGPENESISYPAEGYDACFEVEDSSFWFKHRNECIITLMQHYPPSGMVFDIGGGNGFVSYGLENAGFDAALLEPGKQGVVNAKNRGLKTVICATIDTAKFAAGSLPAIGLFDVVEHIKDDTAFLQLCHNLLAPEGRIYIAVPAYNTLWSDDDEKAGHYRRYTMKEIAAVLNEAGFTVEFSSYIFRFLPLPILLLRALPYRLGIIKKQLEAKQLKRDHAAGNSFIKKILNTLLSSEITRLKARKPMVFGGSCLLVAKKRSA